MILGVKTNFFKISQKSRLRLPFKICFIILQFDPITSKDSTSTVTTESNSSSTSNTSQGKVECTATTASTVTVSPTVALTTSGGIASNVAIETEPGKTSNKSETARLHETNKEKSESSSIGSKQVEQPTTQTAVTSNSSTSNDGSKREPDKNPVAAPEPEPPVSPTGSLHSDSGASATGVRNSSLVIFSMPHIQMRVISYRYKTFCMH